MQTLLPLSEERTIDNQTQFLQFAIVDTQELTRYMDTKASFAIVIIGAIWSVSINYLGDFGRVSAYHWVFILNFGLFLLNLLYCSLLAVHCVSPIHNPAEHIDYEGVSDEDRTLLSRSLFFLPHISQRTGKLESPLGAFIQNLRGMNEEDILKVLAFEFHKVSYLRNVKMLRFRRCFQAMYLMLMHLVVFLSVHYWLISPGK